MTIYTVLKDTIDPEIIKRRTPRAAHAVAMQAEKDMRPLVPARSGTLRDSAKVDGRKVRWTAPYAVEVFNGQLKVDPKYRVGGFPLGNGKFFSRRGVAKVDTGRKMQFAQGHSRWIDLARSLYAKAWIELARKELSRDG